MKKTTTPLFFDTILAFLSIIASLHIHLGSTLGHIPPNVLFKQGFVMALLFLAMGIWTYIPYLRRIHSKMLVIMGLFVASVHVLFWPCMLLLNKTAPLPSLLLLTNSLLLFSMLVSWRALVQWSQPLVRSYLSR